MLKVTFVVDGKEIQPDDFAQAVTSRVHQLMAMHIQEHIEKTLSAKLTPAEMNQVKVVIAGDSPEKIYATISAPDDIMAKARGE